MNLLILIALFSFGYCSRQYVHDESKHVERRLSGGGNYGGFIGLTTYGGGAFFVKGVTDGHGGMLPGVYDTGNKYVGKSQPCIGPHSEAHALSEQCDSYFGFTGPTISDGPQNVVRPCALGDLSCIRNFFAANGKCQPTYGPIPDPLYIGVNTLYYPVANLSVAASNVEIRGLSRTTIRDFYVNKKTNNLVLAIDIANFNEFIPRAYFKFRREAKEPIVLADFFTATFPLMVFTAVIPMVPDLRLEFADIHANFPIVPPLLAGPAAFASTDPQVVSTLAFMTGNTKTILREGIVFQANLLTATYIQKNICDFGLKLISA